MTERGARLEPALLKLLGVLALGAMMATLDATIVNVGLPTLAVRLDAGLDTVEWAATGYLLAVSVATPVSGWAVDRYGGRRMWLVGVVLFTAGSALSSVAWSAPSLIAFRVVQGLGGGMLEPTMLTVLARAAGPSRAGRAMGLVSMPITLGPAVGPVLGGVLVAHLDWRWMFLINIPVGLVVLALSLRVVPGGDERTERPLDVLGLSLLTPGFAALVYALSQAGSAGLGAPRVLVGFALGAVLLAGYVVHALRTRRPPLVDLRLFRIRGYAVAIVLMTLVGGTLFGAYFLVPQYHQQVGGHGPLGAGLLLAPFGLGALVAMPLAGRLSDRIGARLLAPTGAVLAVLALTPFALAAPQPVLAVAAGLLGAALGTVGASSTGTVYRSVPPASAASATTALYVLNQVGGALAIALTTLALGGTGTPTSPYPRAFWVLVAVPALIAVVALALPGRRATVPAPAPEVPEPVG
ncbi:DHA2 family efflux MFS transporter permease subunit [Actinocatenispora rupis]|uniref:MFS transporter n=1 Tax=Actinocatenispora rupis TaxID=519421 RepID=A0A8J3NG80_9ACTN|nr:DHA2 family efflux MFS transporter permease subunit [Actinocatenispora rupis]GID16117.1 MFS transporter [Actinocatenispora rupis]